MPTYLKRSAAANILNCTSPGRVRGSALVVAVFVIVVMLALTLSLSRLLISGSDTMVYEVQGTRALFAAQSALELALTELFPLNSSASCSNVTVSRQFSGAALDGCQVTVSCTGFNDATNGLQLFRLNSVSHCHSGDFITSRTVQLEVQQ